MSPNATLETPKPESPKKLPRQIWVLLAALLVVDAIAFTTFMACNPKVFDDKPPASQTIAKDVVTVFFNKAQGSQSIVENVIRKIPANATDSALTFALQELLKGPTPEEKAQGFYSEIPTGTKLLALNTQKDSITINLSREFSTGGGSNSMLQRLEQVKQTAYSVDSVHPITLAVEGKPLDTLGGEGLEVPDTLKREMQ